MSDSEVQRDLGRLEAQVATLSKGVESLTREMQCVNKTLSEAKGGWRVMLLVAGSAAAIGAVVSKLLPFLTVRS